MSFIWDICILPPLNNSLRCKRRTRLFLENRVTVTRTFKLYINIASLALSKADREDAVPTLNDAANTKDTGDDLIENGLGNLVIGRVPLVA